MIHNEAVRRLIETDRETLIDLMALASAHDGGWRSRPADPDIRVLLEAADARNLVRVDVSAAMERWNADMRAIAQHASDGAVLTNCRKRGAQ